MNMKRFLLILLSAVMILAAATVFASAAEDKTEPELGEYYFGDADGNGKVTSGDARLILRHAARIETLGEQFAPLADLDGDGVVKARDARLALRMAARLDLKYQYKYGAHEHHFSEEITKQATCTEDGERVKTCTVCGATLSEKIVGEHDFVAQITKNPTCTEPGEIVKTCKVCGATEKTELSALGHSFSAATQDSPAKCVRCGILEVEVRASEIKLSLSAGTLNLRRGGSAPVLVKIDAPEKLVFSLAAESESDALGVAWLYDDYGQSSGYLMIAALKLVNGAKVKVYVQEAPQISVSVTVTVGSGGSDRYTGLDALKGVPDFGARNGVPPVGGSASPYGNWIVYVYDENDLTSAGKNPDKAQEDYEKLLRSNGFSYHSDADQYGFMLPGGEEYYYKGGLRVYLDRFSEESDDMTHYVNYLVITLKTSG